MMGDTDTGCFQIWRRKFRIIWSLMKSRLFIGYLADFQPWSITDLSEKKLHPIIFRNVCKTPWTPNIDLFASRVSHQGTNIYFTETRPFSKEKDAFQESWMKGYVFPFFCFIGRVFRKVQIEMDTLILIIPAWQSLAWYPR